MGLGVGHEDRVAVLMERSADLVVAFLAILKAGAAYLPVHEAYPADRRQYLIDHAGAAVLLTDNAMRASWVPTGVPVVGVDDSAVTDQSALDPKVPIHPDQVAYVIHTSGSTGQPKGVAVTSATSFDSCWIRNGLSSGMRGYCWWRRTPSTCPRTRCGCRCCTAARSSSHHPADWSPRRSGA
ncbi:AMP-binding protein [Salinispora arenicola]|uniref:AMP-binding protein n=1 Tax=Salinispora arenicola TaxID=168697 RepID=UPI0027DD2274|nr:AMP-binding protein [Salinispora arenicola]